MEAAVDPIPPPPAGAAQRVKGKAASLEVLLRQRAEGCGAGNALLGRERELASHYGVGRGTLRSAVRELERQGIVRMVPGCRGGLYVADTSVPLAARDISDYLTLSDAPILGIAKLAMALYRNSAVTAARECAKFGSRPLERALSLVSSPPSGDRHIDLWGLTRRAVVAAARNHALTFLHAAFHAAYRDALTAELHLGALEMPRTLALWALERDLIRSAAAGAVEQAYDAAIACTDLEMDYIKQTLADGMLSPTLRPQTLFRNSSADGKLAHQTLRALHAAIRQFRRQPEDRLGSVASLASEFGVSIDVMRDSLRLGQRGGLVTMRRGRSGGVFVGSPGRIHAVRSAASYLRDHATLVNIKAASEALPHWRDPPAVLAAEILKQAVAVKRDDIRP